MIITQNIQLNILNKCFIIENSNNILFIDFDYNKNEIKLNQLINQKLDIQY